VNALSPMPCNYSSHQASADAFVKASFVIIKASATLSRLDSVLHPCSVLVCQPSCQWFAIMKADDQASALSFPGPMLSHYPGPTCQYADQSKLSPCFLII